MLRNDDLFIYLFFFFNNVTNECCEFPVSFFYVLATNLLISKSMKFQYQELDYWRKIGKVSSKFKLESYRVSHCENENLKISSFSTRKN